MIVGRSAWMMRVCCTRSVRQSLGMIISPGSLVRSVCPETLDATSTISRHKVFFQFLSCACSKSLRYDIELARSLLFYRDSPSEAGPIACFLPGLAIRITGPNSSL